MSTSESLILAVDPGGTTGYSYAHVVDDHVNGEPEAGELPAAEFWSWAEDLQRDWGVRLVIISERFTIGQRTLKVSRAGSYDAIETIGVLRHLSLRYGGRDLELQAPSEVMQLFPDTWLKTRGWYRPGKGHANDSLRHLARALAGRGLIRVAN